MNPPINLDDYVDVPERIRLFNEKYPDGTLQGYGSFVRSGEQIVGYIYSASAYRTPDDPRPGVGTAFEPIPGSTPYTRNSEVMNCETSAWGRAIVAVGIPSKRIASANEIAARQPEATPVALPDQRSAAQNNELHRLLGILAATKLTPPDNDSWKSWSKAWIQLEFGKSSSKDLTVAECSRFIEELKRQEAEAPEVPF